MTELENFIKVHGPVMETLARGMELIPPGKEGFQPSPTSLPWMYLAFHPAVHLEVMDRLMDGRADHGFPDLYRAPESRPADGREAARRTREAWASFKAKIEARGMDFMNRALPAPWAGGAPIRVMDWLWWLYEEGTHHRGQTWVYLRINGVVPPSIWGSAERTPEQARALAGA